MAKLLDSLKSSIGLLLRYYGNPMEADAAPGIGIFYRLDLTDEEIDKLALEILETVQSGLQAAALGALLDKNMEEEDGKH